MHCEIASAEKVREFLESLEKTGVLYFASMGRLVRGPIDVALAHPRKLAKGHSARFLVQIYPRALEASAQKIRRSGFPKAEPTTTVTESADIQEGMTVEMLLSSQSIGFDQAWVKKRIGKNVTVVWLNGSPNDNVNAGTHEGILRIRETTEQLELVSLPFSVEISDYAFDHLSRLVVGKLAASITGLGSLAIWVLTAMGHLDKALGWTSGSVALAVAGLLLRHLSVSYKRPHISAVGTLTT
jgi:hypothetical protein